MKYPFNKHGLTAHFLALMTLPAVADTPLSGLSVPKSEPPAAAPKPTVLDEAKAAAATGDVAKAADILKAAAEKGDGVAAINYGEMCLAGRGMKASAGEALKWFEIAAEKGTILGKFRQAQVYQAGAQGVPKDEDRAQFLINAAATEGQADAQHALGVAAEQAGRKADAASEREKYFTEAMGWYEKAAAQNQPNALLAMAKFLDQGLGGASKDPTKGMENSFKAAQAGLLSAIMDMGQRYLQGRGIRTDNVAALGWFLVAAEGGSSEGMIRLGQAYEKGQGVPPNLGKAAAWYASAAKLNAPAGQFLLAGLQEEGRGIEKNLVYAYINYRLAADGGMDEAVGRRRAVKEQLTPAQIKEAEALMAPPPKSDAPK